MKSRTINLVLAGSVLVMPLAGCNSPYRAPDSGEAGARASGEQVGEVRGGDVNCYNCGYVTSIDEVAMEGEPSGLGAVIGAVVGGVAGNQVGGGSGQDIATAAGAVGGAVAGNEIEKQRNTRLAYDVEVDMDTGADRVIRVNRIAALEVGTYVEIEDGDLLIRQ